MIDLDCVDMPLEKIGVEMNMEEEDKTHTSVLIHDLLNTEHTVKLSDEVWKYLHK